MSCHTRKTRRQLKYVRYHLNLRISTCSCTQQLLIPLEAIQSTIVHAHEATTWPTEYSDFQPGMSHRYAFSAQVIHKGFQTVSLVWSSAEYLRAVFLRKQNAIDRQPLLAQFTDTPVTVTHLLRVMALLQSTAQTCQGLWMHTSHQELYELLIRKQMRRWGGVGRSWRPVLRRYAATDSWKIP